MPTSESAAPFSGAFANEPQPGRKARRPRAPRHEEITLAPWKLDGVSTNSCAPLGCAQFVLDAHDQIIGHKTSEADEWFFYEASLTGKSLRGVLVQLRPDWDEHLPAALAENEASLALPELIRGASGVVLGLHRLRVGVQMYVTLTPELAPAEKLKQTGLADFTPDSSTFAKLFLRLRLVENRLEHYLAHLPGVVFHQRADLSFAYIGPGCESLMGLEPQSLSKDSQALLRLIHPGDERGYYQELHRNAEAVKPFSLVYRVLNPQTGTYLYLLDVRSPVRAGSGLLLGYEGVWLDITRQKIAEHRLTTRAWKESLSALTSGLLNDFGDVMTGIYSLSELYHSALPAKHPLRDGLGMIKDSAGQAQRLVSKIIDLNRDTSGDKTYVNLGKIVRDQAELLKIIFPRGTLLLAPAHDGDWPVYLDETSFRQTLVNLAMNARDALHGTGEVELSLRKLAPGDAPAAGTTPALPRPAAASVELIFRDNGTGIAAAHLPRIFDPFFSTKESPRGAGLGLYNARLFAYAHGGHLAVRSTPGRGAELILLLPLADLSLPEPDAFRAGSLAKRTRVLSFEPNMNEESGLVDTLRHQLHCEVATVTTAEHARRMLREEGSRLDLVIIRQPREDAELLMLLAEIRRDHAGLPVALALSGQRLLDCPPSLRTQVDLLLSADIRDRDAAEAIAKLLRLP